MPGWSARTRRLIPAHAGKTWSRPCGSNARHGSSPLTRGKRRGTIRRGLCAGLIPAHAGKTVPDWEHKALPGAHPRSRGENHRRSAPNGIKSGSSPLTRGKRAKVCPRHYRLRLIPAHAGKTFSEPLRRSRAWAHPRSRGENDRVPPRVRCRRGSSPLTRGKRPCVGDGGSLVGLIPAHAGKTRKASVQSTSVRAHPRSRGENCVGVLCAGCASGSSPLTRGKPVSVPSHEPVGGLIPAHAGKTVLVCCALVARRAHPRSRGENPSRFRPTSQ